MGREAAVLNSLDADKGVLEASGEDEEVVAAAMTGGQRGRHKNGIVELEEVGGLELLWGDVPIATEEPWATQLSNCCCGLVQYSSVRRGQTFGVLKPY